MQAGCDAEEREGCEEPQRQATVKAQHPVLARSFSEEVENTPKAAPAATVCC